MRRFLLLPFLVLAVVAAGCGSAAENASSGGGSTPAGSSMVRAGVLAFVSLDSDTGSDQWQQLDKLAQKFPGRDQAVAQLKQQLTQQGVDYEHDVKPALGPELDVAVTSGGTEASTNVVGLTKPDDPAKLKALVAKLNAKDSSGDKTVYREVDGWYALSDNQAAITAVLKGDQGALADDDTFKEAMGKLPEGAIAKVFLDGQRLGTLVSRAAAASGTGGGFDPSTLGLDKLKYVSLSASAEDDGVRVRGASSGGPSGGNDSAKLAESIPADAFALLDIPGGLANAQLGKLRSNQQLAPAIAQLEQALGVSLEQVLALLGGETAFYARPGAVIPELTLVLSPENTAAGMSTLDKLMSRLAAGAHAQVEPGAQGKTVNFGSFAVHYGTADGKIVLSSGVNGISDFGGSGDNLTDSADFKEARDAAGMPDSTGGFMYLDLKNALPLIEGFAALAGQSIPPHVSDNLRPLRSFLAWSEGGSDSRTFDAFLEIK